MIKEAGLKPRQLPVSNILAQRKAELLKVIPAWETGEKSGIFAENFFPDNPVDLLKRDYAALWAKPARSSPSANSSAKTTSAAAS
ncbi:hypothetical protein BH10ACI2_BH10ACI2_06280 [soil metagenome]